MKNRSRLSLIVISAVIITGILFSLYVKGKISSINSLRADLSTLSVDTTIQAAANPYAFENLKQLVPQKSNTPAFIEYAYRIAQKYAVEDISFEQKTREHIEPLTGQAMPARSPAQKEAKGIYSYPIKIRFESSYRNAAEFLRELQNAERLVQVRQLTMNRNKDSLHIDMQVIIFSTEAP